MGYRELEIITRKPYRRGGGGNKESIVMKELHKIRLKHYEDTKNMPISEKIKITNANGKHILNLLNERKNIH